MQVFKSKINGVFVVEPQVFGDERGYFMESFNKSKLEEAIGYDIDFVQDNESMSSKGVLRGFAFQKAPYTQAKLVRVTEGQLLDVVLDMRADSTTFGQYAIHKLSAKNKKQIFIPRGVAHAFITLSETATLQYKVDHYFNAASEAGVIYNDADLKIDWQMDASEIIVSEKDLSRPNFKQAEYFKEGF